MEQLTGEVQEYWRRQMVALIRGAGTTIRKEEVKRQALSARVNLKEAARLRQEVLDDCKTLLPTEVLEKMQKASAEEISKYLGDYLQKIILSIVAIPAQLSRVQAHFQTLNDLVSMANRIIQDLSNEGIYLVPVQSVTVPPDILSAVFSLPRALENASRVLGILEGVVQAAEEL
jgi:Mg2+ and Co2+ transporter CorA